MKRILFVCACLLGFAGLVVAQNPVEATSATARLAGFEVRKSMIEQSPFKQLPFRNVGPTVMSGRVVDVDVRLDDPSHFVVAYASGSVWKTTNNGSTFEPIFDHEATPTIGDIAVDWNRGIIYVGTGENNSSRSSYAGTGVYRSDDWGKTWKHLGLAETHRTGRIILHPDNPDMVWVAAAGALYSPNPERGVYRSVDGGKTWAKILFVDDTTGAIDLVADPRNPDVLFAAMWKRERRAWNFVEGGETSGIYKSDDGGTTWALISTEASGFPRGEGVGRIGLAVFDSNTIYALLDNQFDRPAEETETTDDLTRDMLRNMDEQSFLALDEKVIQKYLDDNRFPREYSASAIVKMVKEKRISPVALVEFVEDANSQLFNSRVVEAEVYRSDDGGKTWTKTHDEFINGLYNTYGYYFGEIRVAAYDSEKIYILGVPILRSDDGGKTFQNIGGEGVHADHQALWVNPNRPGHLIDGNDGGLNISWDDGESWFKINTPPVGQFYAITYDMAEPYNVYGGLQDNGVWFGPSNYRQSRSWYGSGRYPYQSIGGGDGMQVQVDFRDNKTIYSGSQFGFYSRQNEATGDRQSIRPRHKLGERPLRFNWQTPILLSRHNQDILYMAANRLYRSLDKGVNFEPISEDLTNGGKYGDVPYGTISAIDESALKFGLLYTGSDDGAVHVSKDGGNTWKNISGGLPSPYWVSEVKASAHDINVVYVTLNGYRWDNFTPLVFRSANQGTTWTRIGRDLPLEPVNALVEDPVNENVIYVGTDMGTYASLDAGQSFFTLGADLPSTPVHDLAVHPRENELIIGTHGRSIWAGDVSIIQALTPETRERPVFAFDIKPVQFSDRWGTRFSSQSDYFVPSHTLPFYTTEGSTVELTIKDSSGRVLSQKQIESVAGVNMFSYDLTIDEGKTGDQEAKDDGNTYLKVGKYTVGFQVGDTTAETEMEVKGR